MKLPRDLSEEELVKHLSKRWGYVKIHQVGSHIILQTQHPTLHRGGRADYYRHFGKNGALNLQGKRGILCFVQIVEVKLRKAASSAGNAAGRCMRLRGT
ncbi:MAG: hypothetical protein ABSC77_11350 [Terracidiphilus sp.]|jgi:hypothetical protein